jgi:hypothetical protein
MDPYTPEELRRVAHIVAIPRRGHRRPWFVCEYEDESSSAFLAAGLPKKTRAKALRSAVWAMRGYAFWHGMIVDAVQDCLDCGYCEWCIDRSIAAWEDHNQQSEASE